MKINVRIKNALLLMTIMFVSSGVFAEDCDRGCMKGLLDRYLNAVVQNNPAAVPLTPGYRQTENAVVSRPGQGIWKTAKGLGKVQRRYFDPITSTAGFFGTEEAGVVLGLGVFLRKSGVAMRRNVFSEWFLIERGKIQSIYSSMFYPEDDALVPNWPPYDGNWPVLPTPK